MVCSIYTVQVFGFQSNEFPALEQELGLIVDPDQEDSFLWESAEARAFNKVVRQAQAEALATIGWEVQPNNGVSSSIPFKHRDTGELREFYGAYVELFWNDGDLGQRFEDALIGIQIAGDFSPILIDHQYKDGRLNAELLPDRFALLCEFQERLMTLQSPVWSHAQLREIEVFY